MTKKERRKEIVQLLDSTKRKVALTASSPHFDAVPSIGDDDDDEETSPFTKFFKHLLANVAYGCP